MGETRVFTDLLLKIIDNRGRTCPIASYGTPLIATNCVKSANLYPTYENIRYVDEATMRSWFRGHPLPGDILFVCKGSPGQVCLVPDPIDFCIAQDMVAVRADPSKIYPPYLFAALRSATVQDQIANMHVGTMIPHFKKGDFNKLHIPFPDRSAQTAIGDLYLELSLKIELNRRMNETLEASARALFRDWFVDFGPTRAKAEGRLAYLAPDLWSLFPDRLGDEGVPEGWKVKPLDQIADFLNGLALQKYPAVLGEEYLPVIKIAELRSGISANSNRASPALPAKYVIEDGDFLFSWSGSLLAKFWTNGRGALNQHLFKVTSKDYPAWFYTHWVWHHLEDFQMIAASKATTMGHIQRGHLSAANTLCPPPTSLAAFGEIMGMLQRRLIENLIESRSLGETRDMLLPKLMSGEIRVRDAQAMAEVHL